MKTPPPKPPPLLPQPSAPRPRSRRPPSPGLVKAAPESPLATITRLYPELAPVHQEAIVEIVRALALLKAR